MSKADHILLDKLMTKHGVFDTKNKNSLETIWDMVGSDYNIGLPEDSQKTGKQLSVTYRNWLDKTRIKFRLDLKEDRDVLVTHWKSHIANLLERRQAEKKIAGRLTISHSLLGYIYVGWKP